MPVSGEFETPTVGRLYEDDTVGGYGHKSAGEFSVVYFTAESDLGGATGPCFSVVGPTIFGKPVRVSGWPVSGFAPTSSPTLTVSDEWGSSWTVAMDTTGSAAFTHSIPTLAGECTFSFNTFGAGGKRYRVAIIIQTQNTA